MNTHKILFLVLPIILMVLISELRVTSATEIKTEQRTYLSKLLDHYIPKEWDVLISPRISSEIMISDEEVDTWKIILAYRLFCIGLDVTFKNQEVIIQKFQNEKPERDIGLCRNDLREQISTTKITQDELEHDEKLEFTPQSGLFGFKVVPYQQIQLQTTIDAVEESPTPQIKPPALFSPRSELTLSQNQTQNLEIHEPTLPSIANKKPELSVVTQEFRVTAGNLLSTTIAEWAQKVGWSSSWELEDDLQFEFSATFKGNLETVAKQLANTVDQTTRPFSIELNRGNKVLRVFDGLNTN